MRSCISVLANLCCSTSVFLSVFYIRFSFCEKYDFYDFLRCDLQFPICITTWWVLGLCFCNTRVSCVRVLGDGLDSFVSQWSHFGCWSRRFDCNTASLHQAMRSIVYVLLLVARWFSYRCPSISINLPVGIWCSLIGPHWLTAVCCPIWSCVSKRREFLIPLSGLTSLGWSLIWITSWQWLHRETNE